MTNLGKCLRRLRADAARGRVLPHQLGKARLDLLVASAQRVVGRVRNRRRVLLIVALVVGAELGRKPFELGLGLRVGEIGDRDFAAGLRAHRLRHSGAGRRRRSYPAALIRRSAAARASAVISAPASMRAISSRRLSAATSATRVATRLPLSSALLLMR